MCRAPLRNSRYRSRPTWSLPYGLGATDPSCGVIGLLQHRSRSRPISIVRCGPSLPDRSPGPVDAAPRVVAGPTAGLLRILSRCRASGLDTFAHRLRLDDVSFERSRQPRELPLVERWQLGQYPLQAGPQFFLRPPQVPAQSPHLALPRHRQFLDAPRDIRASQVGIEVCGERGQLVGDLLDLAADRRPRATPRRSWRCT